MGLFSHLNVQLLAALERRSGTTRVMRVSVLGAQLVLVGGDGTQQVWPLAQLQRAVAIRRDSGAGNEVSLVLEWDAARIAELPSSCDGWLELCAAIERLDGAVPFGRWHALAMAASGPEAVDIWQRGSPAGR